MIDETEFWGHHKYFDLFLMDLNPTNHLEIPCGRAKSQSVTYYIFDIFRKCGKTILIFLIFLDVFCREKEKDWHIQRGRWNFLKGGRTLLKIFKNGENRKFSPLSGKI